MTLAPLAEVCPEPEQSQRQRTEPGVGTSGLFHHQWHICGHHSSWRSWGAEDPSLACSQRENKAPDAGPRLLLPPQKSHTCLPSLSSLVIPGLWPLTASLYWACPDQSICAEEMIRPWRRAGSGGKKFHLQLSAGMSPARHNAWHPMGAQCAFTE